MNINGRYIRWQFVFLFIANLTWVQVSSAQLLRAEPSYPNYFSISQKVVSQSFQGPYEVAGGFFQQTVIAASSVFNLLKWDNINRQLPIPNEPYNRDKHFGSWIDDSRDNNCLDTRGKILVRSSRVPVTYTNSSQCIVATGEWLDPYTNQIFRSAKEIQIDHFVPLHQAYTTGASTWDKKYRCLYSNYLFNQIQLLAVSGLENQKKQDHAPDRYMPPNKKIWCSYLSQWLKVKLIWNLVMTPPEAKGIADIFTALKCNPNEFQMQAVELQNQRATIRTNALYCDYDAHQGGLRN